MCDGWSGSGGRESSLVMVFPASPAGSVFCSDASFCFVGSRDQNVRPIPVDPSKGMLAVGRCDLPDPGLSYQGGHLHGFIHLPYKELGHA